MSYGDHEDAPGQLELNSATTGAGPHRRQPSPRTARSAPPWAASTDCWRRSLPKPFTGVSANGHHHHFTLVDDEGKNVFHDPDGVCELSETGRHFSAACSTISAR